MLRFVKEISSGLVLGQYIGEGERSTAHPHYGSTIEEVVYYYDFRGEKCYVAKSDAKVSTSLRFGRRH